MLSKRLSVIEAAVGAARAISGPYLCRHYSSATEMECGSLLCSGARSILTRAALDERVPRAL